jgi:hypothetical protein
VRRKETGADATAEEERRRKAKVPGLFRQDLNKDTSVWAFQVPHWQYSALFAPIQHYRVCSAKRRQAGASTSPYCATNFFMCYLWNHSTLGYRFVFPQLNSYYLCTEAYFTLHYSYFAYPA